MTRTANIMEERCGHLCNHLERCEDGCYPESMRMDGQPEIDFDAWTCIGGTRYRLYDEREE